MAAPAAGGGPHRPALLAPLLLLLAALPLGCAAIPYVQDELLWTKQNWQEYKLPFPWSAVLQERDPEGTRQLSGPLRGYAANSLNGPLQDAALLAKQAQEDARRPPVGVAPQSDLQITLLDETASQEAAAGVTSCKVCGALVKHLWQGLTHWVNLKQQVPSQKRVAAYAAQLCEYEVPNDVLEHWVLLRARVQAGGSLPFAVEGQPAGAQGQEFYLLSQRTKRQHAQPAEIDSVRKACRALLREDAVGADKERQVLSLANSMLHQYFRQLDKRLNPATAKSVWEAVETVDDGPEAERACYNRHPQCKLWLEKGECESNTKYMVGDPGAEGWCRPTCGACVAEREPHGLTGEVAKKMQEVASSSTAVLQSQACLSGAPCKWAAGTGMKQLLSQARSGAAKASGEVAQLMEDAAYISGPVLSRQQQLEAALDQDKLKETKPMLTRPLADAVVPEKQAGQPLAQPVADDSPASKALEAALKDKCLYVNTGWWMYQLCYQRHITQFHMTEKLEVDWVISLGKFEGADWTLDSTDESTLYPHTTRVPFVTQSFGEGNQCDLDAEPRTGEARSVQRRSTLRLMCSPDLDSHVTVKEPRQCVYTVELYLPQLCKLEGFAPELPEGMAESLDAAWNSQGGAGAGQAAEREAAAEAAAARREQQVQASQAASAARQAARDAAEAARKRAAAAAAAAAQDDDPYEDPDEAEARDEL